jgi:hypothetical protein
VARVESDRRFDAIHKVQGRLIAASDKFFRQIEPYLKELEAEKQKALKEYQEMTK